MERPSNGFPLDEVEEPSSVHFRQGPAWVSVNPASQFHLQAHPFSHPLVVTESSPSTFSFPGDIVKIPSFTSFRDLHKVNFSKRPFLNNQYKYHPHVHVKFSSPPPRTHQQCVSILPQISLLYIHVCILRVGLIYCLFPQ